MYATKETKEKIRKALKKIRQGKNNPNWKGGDRYYYRRQARRIIEKEQGIKLRDLVVHHKDRDWKNNSLENLQVMTFSQHGKIHHPYKEKITKKGLWQRRRREWMRKKYGKLLY